MKLNESKHVNVKEKWVDKINFEEAGIPIVTNIPKDELTTKTSVSFFQRMRRMAEILRDSSARYKTVSDVIRAAIYIGIPILFKMQEDEVTNQYGKNLYEQVRRNTLFYEQVQAIDTVVIEVNRLLEYAKSENVNIMEVNKQIDDILASVPSDCQSIAKSKAAEVRSLRAKGRDISHLLACRIHPKMSDKGSVMGGGV